MDSKTAVFVTICVAVTQAVAFGTSSSFPVYVEHLRDSLPGSPSLATLSLTRSLVPASTSVFSNFATLFMAKFGPRVTLIACGAFMALAMEVVPFNDSTWGFMITYILLMSLCVSFLVAPGLAVATTWFSNPNVGSGVTEFGTSVGCAAMPPVIAKILTFTDDWRMAMRIVGGFAGLVVLSAAFVRYPRDDEKATSDGGEDKHNKEKKSDDNSSSSSSILPLLKTKKFLVVLLLQICFGFCFFGVNFIIIPFGRAQGSNSSSAYQNRDRLSLVQASSLMTILNVMSGVGAIVSGTILSEKLKVSPRTIFVVYAALAALALGLVPLADGSYWQFALLFAVCGWCFSGGLAMIPAFLVALFLRDVGPAMTGRLIGASFSAFGLVGGAGPPLLTFMAECNGMDYSWSWATAAASMLCLALIALIWWPSDGDEQEQEQQGKKNEKRVVSATERSHLLSHGSDYLAGDDEDDDERSNVSAMRSNLGDEIGHPAAGAPVRSAC